MKSPKFFSRTPKEALGPSGVVTPHSGLINLGNTCYFNATIQALSHLPTLSWDLLCALKTPPLGAFDSLTTRTTNKALASFAPGSYFKTSKDPMNIRLYSFMKTLQNTRHGKIDPSDLYYTFLSQFTLFLHGEQQDAHEMFILLISFMIEQETIESFSHYSFNGKLRLNAECASCKLSSDNPQHFTALTVNMSNSVQESVNEYLSQKTSVIDGDYRCERCGSTSSAVYNMRITMWPPIMCVHLNRAMLKKRLIVTGVKATKNTSDIEIEDIITVSGRTYYLMSTIHHVGSSMNSGHYYAYGNTCEGWRCYNDEIVKVSTPMKDPGTVYMLFYVRHDIYDNLVKTLKK